MQQNYRKLFMTLSVLLMYSLASIVCLAAEREYQEISLSEALNLAFLQNTNYQLALWEHDLQLQEQALTQNAYLQSTWRLNRLVSAMVTCNQPLAVLM